MHNEQPAKETPATQATGSSQPMTYAQQRFYASGLCEEARELLQALVNSPDYNTDPSPLVSSPIPFVERHLRYLSMRPKADLNGYMSNLRLMTSLKRSRPAS